MKILIYVWSISFTFRRASFFFFSLLILLWLSPLTYCYRPFESDLTSFEMNYIKMRENFFHNPCDIFLRQNRMTVFEEFIKHFENIHKILKTKNRKIFIFFFSLIHTYVNVILSWNIFFSTAISLLAYDSWEKYVSTLFLDL